MVYIEKSALEDLSSPLTREELSEGKLALIIIDMQYNLTAQGHGVLKQAKELGVREGYEYYYDRIQNYIIPNIQKLLRSFRESEEMIVFTKLRSDNSYSDVEKKSSHEGLETDEGVILKQVSPSGEDIVITKDDPDIFQGTGLDSRFRERGIDTLIMSGVLTNECVETSVLQAVEKGYRVILVEDSTAAFSEKIHDKALDLIQDNSVIITSTEDILNLI